jgi:hypothetical protein
MCGHSFHPGFWRNGRVEFSFLVYASSKNAIEILWWLRTSQLGGGLTIPRVICGAQGPSKINVRMKGELTGSYSLRVAYPLVS